MLGPGEGHGRSDGVAQSHRPREVRNTWPKMSGEELNMDGWSFLVGRYGVNGYHV